MKKKKYVKHGRFLVGKDPLSPYKSRKVGVWAIEDISGKRDFMGIPPHKHFATIPAAIRDLEKLYWRKIK